MTKLQKEVAIGLVVGLIANTLGTLLYTFILSKFSGMGVVETYKAAMENDHVGSLLAFGALLNLIAFFGFLRLKRDHRSRGVMIATVITALVILYFKVF